MLQIVDSRFRRTGMDRKTICKLWTRALRLRLTGRESRAPAPRKQKLLYHAASGRPRSPVCGRRGCTFRMATVLSAIVEMKFGDAANVSEPAASRVRLFKLGLVYAKSYIISTTTAKFTTLGHIASSLSNRVRMRRQLLSLRNGRPTSF